MDKLKSLTINKEYVDLIKDRFEWNCAPLPKYENGVARMELIDSINENAYSDVEVDIEIDMSNCSDYQLESGVYQFEFEVYLKDSDVQRTVTTGVHDIMLNKKGENYSVNNVYFDSLTEVSSYIKDI